MARKYTTDEVCELVMKDSDHKMEEYIFSGSDDELDAEVLEELDAREMEDMLVGANVILGNDTDYSSDNDDDSYVGDYASKIGGNDSDRESNTSSDMNLQSSGSRGKKDVLVVEVVVVIEVVEVVEVVVEVMVKDVIELVVESRANLIVAAMMLIYNGVTKLQMSPFNHLIVYQDQQ